MGDDRGPRILQCSHRVATWPVRLIAGKYSAVEPPSAAASVVASSLPGISKEDQEILAMLEDGDDDRYTVLRAMQIGSLPSFMSLPGFSERN